MLLTRYNNTAMYEVPSQKKCQIKKRQQKKKQKRNQWLQIMTVEIEMKYNEKCRSHFESGRQAFKEHLGY